jgi:anti-anti-sigma factor
MRIDQSFDEGVVFLTVVGELDMTSADELQQVGVSALNPFCGTLRIDLGGVTLLDSAGIGALLAIRNRAEPTHTLILDNPQPHARRILELTGLSGVFDQSASAGASVADQRSSMRPNRHTASAMIQEMKNNPTMPYPA